MRIKKSIIAVLIAVAGSSVLADINIGVSLTSTGPAAVLGIPIKNAIGMLPTSVAGQKINYIVLDDATDPTKATTNARKLTSEDKVDLLLGSSTVPTSLAISEIANESQTPQLALAPAMPAPPKDRWVFAVPQPTALMAKALLDHMYANGVKTLGVIAVADPWGEAWIGAIGKLNAMNVGASSMKILDAERYNRSDSSVTGQVIKLVAAKPDAILIASSGTPAALPQIELTNRGYKGRIYQTHAAASKEVLKVGGKAMNGAVLPVGPIIVADQLPDANPIKQAALTFIAQYEGKYGAGSISPFAAHANDAFQIINRAVPIALKTAQPGTPAFRLALRDAIEAERDVVGANSIFNMGEKDHFGQDARSRVLVEVQNGAWKLLPGK